MKRRKSSQISIQIECYVLFFALCIFFSIFVLFSLNERFQMRFIFVCSLLLVTFHVFHHFGEQSICSFLVQLSYRAHFISNVTFDQVNVYRDETWQMWMLIAHGTPPHRKMNQSTVEHFFCHKSRIVSIQKQTNFNKMWH